jgi:hypothetical protein
MVNCNIALAIAQDDFNDGYIEYCNCEYPIFWAYKIIPESRGCNEYEYHEPVDIGVNSPNVFEVVKKCPGCNTELNVRYK